MRWWPALLLAAGLHRAAQASGDYPTPDAFLRAAFGSQVPAPTVLWPSPALQARILDTLGHPYRQLRIRYWRDGSGQRTAWILADVGKTEDITLGFVIKNGAIESTEVLDFREERGWEIRFPAFRAQFQGQRLDGLGQRLTRPVDGITGATLSVAAYTRMARMALQLHQSVTETSP